jgi:hypothetical protein
LGCPVHLMRFFAASYLLQWVKLPLDDCCLPYNWPLVRYLVFRC